MSARSTLGRHKTAIFNLEKLTHTSLDVGVPLCSAVCGMVWG